MSNDRHFLAVPGCHVAYEVHPSDSHVSRPRWLLVAALAGDDYLEVRGNTVELTSLRSPPTISLELGHHCHRRGTRGKTRANWPAAAGG
jgi:hypothetical protein